MSEYQCGGWACVDCTMRVGNGELPEWMSKDELDEYEHNVEITSGMYSVELGMAAEDHECGAADFADAECGCEQVTFTWSACDVCGSRLGGERYAVTFWTIDPPTTTHQRLAPGHSLRACMVASELDDTGRSYRHS
jgi:hypothetical protein